MDGLEIQQATPLNAVAVTVHLKERQKFMTQNISTLSDELRDVPF
jgi:hypothetical protein